jgi:hypothetical protein
LRRLNKLSIDLKLLLKGLLLIRCVEKKNSSSCGQTQKSGAKMMSAIHYQPDQWVLSLSGALGILTVTTNLTAFVRALKVR